MLKQNETNNYWNPQCQKMKWVPISHGLRRILKTVIRTNMKTIWNAWLKLWEQFSAPIQHVERPLMLGDQRILQQEEKQDMMLSGESQRDGWYHLKASYYSATWSCSWMQMAGKVKGSSADKRRTLSDQCSLCCHSYKHLHPPSPYLFRMFCTWLK